ncbi:hypothetical protein D3C85_1408450 [compost metagenome]
MRVGQIRVAFMKKEVSRVTAKTIAPLFDTESDPVRFQQVAMVPIPLGQLAYETFIRFQRAEHVQHARPLRVQGADINAEQWVQMFGQLHLISHENFFDAGERHHALGDFGEVRRVIAHSIYSFIDLDSGGQKRTSVTCA